MLYAMLAAGAGPGHTTFRRRCKSADTLTHVAAAILTASAPPAGPPEPLCLADSERAPRPPPGPSCRAGWCVATHNSGPPRLAQTGPSHAQQIPASPGLADGQVKPVTAPPIDQPVFGRADRMKSITAAGSSPRRDLVLQSGRRSRSALPQRRRRGCCLCAELAAPPAVIRIITGRSTPG